MMVLDHFYTNFFQYLADAFFNWRLCKDLFILQLTGVLFQVPTFYFWNFVFLYGKGLTILFQIAMMVSQH